MLHMRTRERRAVFTTNAQCIPEDDGRSPVAAVIVSALVTTASATTGVLLEHTTTTTTAVVVATATTAAAAIAPATATAAATAAAAAAVATTTAAAEPTATATTVLTRAGFIDRQGSSIEILAIERLDRSPTLRIVHLDEAEASRATGLPIGHEMDTLHFTMRREEFLNLFLVG